MYINIKLSNVRVAKTDQKFTVTESTSLPQKAVDQLVESLHIALDSSDDRWMELAEELFPEMMVDDCWTIFTWDVNIEVKEDA